jgi:tol-pal system protein YbgF
MPSLKDKRVLLMVLLPALFPASFLAAASKEQMRTNRAIEDLQDQVYSLQRSREAMTGELKQIREELESIRAALAALQGAAPSRTRIEEPTPTPAPRSSRDVTPPAQPTREPARTAVVVTPTPAPQETVTEGAARAVPTPTPTAAPKEDPAQKLYDQAYREYVWGNYEKAIELMERLIASRPKPELAANARFYVADSYFREENFPQAIVEFQKVLDQYRGSEKSAEALYRIGLAYLELNDEQNAGVYFEKVIKTYPNSDSAVLAGKRLNEMRRAKKQR